MRRVSIPRPFAGGYRSDVPDYALEESEAAFAQDVAAPLGIAQQRRGWEFRGTSPVVGSGVYLTAVARARFPVTGRTRTVACDSNGRVYVTDEDGTQILLWDNPTGASTYFIPRCVYNGDLIICAQDGKTPLLRYGGSTLPYLSLGQISTASFSLPVGSQTITGSSPVVVPPGLEKGAFFTFTPFGASSVRTQQPKLSSRIIQTNGTTTFTLETIRNVNTASATGTDTAYVLPVGFTWPAVSIYEAGKMTSVSGGFATFEGADFSATGTVPLFGDAYRGPDALLVINPDNATTGAPHQIASVISNSSSAIATNVTGFNLANAAYRLLRRCPFKDAAVHRGSLWGTGVSQYPSRVYVFPPTADIGIAPGDVSPIDPTKNAGYSSATVTGFTTVNEYLCGAYDVPGPYDASPNVAILSSPGPLLVLKTDAVYGIFGTYDQANPAGSIETTRIANNAGCIDLRSAVTAGSIPYWAGEEGVFTYQNGAVSSLTDGKISDEWRVLMRAYVQGTSWVTTAVSGGFLIISCGGLDTTKTTDAIIGTDTTAPSGRTFVYDTRANVWLGRITNFNPRHMFAFTSDTNASAIYSVDSNFQGRVIDIAPSFTNGATAIDAGGTGPRMKAWTRSSLAQASGVEGETRLCDALIHTNLYDLSTPTSQIDVSVVSGGALDDKPDSTKVLSSITADTVDRVDRNKRIVNRSGRLHQIRVDMSVTDSSNVSSDIPEVMLSFRDSRRGT